MEEILIQIRDILSAICVICLVIMCILWTTLLSDFFKDLVDWIKNRRKKSKSNG